MAQEPDERRFEPVRLHQRLVREQRLLLCPRKLDLCRQQMAHDRDERVDAVAVRLSAESVAKLMERE